MLPSIVTDSYQNQLMKVYANKQAKLGLQISVPETYQYLTPTRPISTLESEIDGRGRGSEVTGT